MGQCHTFFIIIWKFSFIYKALRICILSSTECGQCGKLDFANGDGSDLWGFLFRYVGGLCLRLLCCLFVFSVQPFANVVANYIYCDRDKNNGDYFIQWFHLLSAGGSAASTPYHNSSIFSIPTLLKLNSSIRSYTLLYRILAFRHIKYWKILYRCSGTFRQK